MQAQRPCEVVTVIHFDRVSVASRRDKTAAVLTLLALLTIATPARAQGDPKEAPENLPLDLSPITRFADVASARRHCAHGDLVWPDAATGYFHAPRSPRFDAARGGFACRADALAAGYWDTDPFSGGPHRDRSFPIDPALRPDFGS
jgi:hypothetical protein